MERYLQAFRQTPVLEAHKLLRDGKITAEEGSHMAGMGLSLLFDEVEKGAGADTDRMADVAEACFLLAGTDLVGSIVPLYATVVAEELGKRGETGAADSGLVLGTLGETLRRLEGAQKASSRRGDSGKADLLLSRDHIAALADKVRALEEDSLWLLPKEPEERPTLKKQLQIIYNYVQIAKTSWQPLRAGLDADTPEATPIRTRAEEVREAVEGRTPYEVWKDPWPGKESEEERAKRAADLAAGVRLGNVDDWERLLWLDAEESRLLKALAVVEGSFGKKQPAGWLGGEIRSVEGRMNGGPEIPRATAIPRVLGALVFLVLAALALFHPASTAFFETWSMQILALGCIAIFVVGANYGGFLGGVVAGGLWIGATFLLNKFVGIGLILRILLALVVAIPAVALLAGVKGHTAGAVRRAKARRADYLRKQAEACGPLLDYVRAVCARLTQLEQTAAGETGGLKKARAYYKAMESRLTAAQRKG